MASRRTLRQIASHSALEEFLRVEVDGGELLQEVARHLHLAEAVEEHREGQVHHRHALLVALIQLNRCIALLHRGVDEHELVAAPESIVLREPQHLLALLRRKAELACREQRLQIGETEEHIGLCLGHRPELADVLLGKEPLLRETRCCLARQIFVVVDAVIGIARQILDAHTRRRDVLRLDAQDALDDAVALLARRLACACNQLIQRECIHLTRQIGVLTQTLAELRDDLGHAFHADLSALGLHHAIQFVLHPFLVCHARHILLLVVSSLLYFVFYKKARESQIKRSVLP